MKFQLNWLEKSSSLFDYSVPRINVLQNLVIHDFPLFDREKDFVVVVVVLDAELLSKFPQN